MNLLFADELLAVADVETLEGLANAAAREVVARSVCIGSRCRFSGFDARSNFSFGSVGEARFALVVDGCYGVGVLATAHSVCELIALNRCAVHLNAIAIDVVAHERQLLCC